MVWLASAKWHQGWLKRALLDARLDLGERLVEKRDADEQVLSQIAALDAKIKILTEGKGSTKAPKSERDRLLIDLADRALGKPVAPAGLEGEYHAARAAQAKLNAHSEKIRTSVFPNWGRAIVGYIAVACIVVVSLFWFSRASRDNPPSSTEIAIAPAKSDSAENPTKRESLQGPAAQAESPAKAPAEEPKAATPLLDPLPAKGQVESSSSSKETMIRTAEGIGATHDEALKDAFRKAIWQVVGVVVDAETITKNDEIASDQILTYANGTISKYEELGNIADQGLCRVKIRAAVEKRKVFENLKASTSTSISVKATQLYADLAAGNEKAKNDQEKGRRPRLSSSECSRGFR